MRSEVLSLLYQLLLSLLTILGQWLSSLSVRFPKIGDLLESFVVGLHKQAVCAE